MPVGTDLSRPFSDYKGQEDVINRSLQAFHSFPKTLRLKARPLVGVRLQNNFSICIVIAALAYLRRNNSMERR